MKNPIIFLYVLLNFHIVSTFAVEAVGIEKSVVDAESIFVGRVISGSIKDFNANLGYAYEIDVGNILLECKLEKLTGLNFSYQKLKLGSEYLFFVRDCSMKNIFVVLEFDEMAEQIYNKKYLKVNRSFTPLIAVLSPDAWPVIGMGYPKKYIPNFEDIEFQEEGEHIITDFLLEWDLLEHKIISILSTNK